MSDTDSKALLEQLAQKFDKMHYILGTFSEESRQKEFRVWNEAMTKAAEWTRSLAAAPASPASDAMRLLESLTPGGSEFVGDAERCASYVREKIISLQDIAKNAVRRNQANPAGSGASVFAEVIPGRKAANWAEVQPPEVELSEFLRLATRIQEMNEDRRLNGGLSYAQWDELVMKADAVIANAKAKGKE